MEKIKQNIFVKLTVFILVQICTLLIVCSAFIVVVNSNYNFYVSNREEVESVIVSEVADKFSSDISNSIYYDDASNSLYYDDVSGHDYIAENTALPEGVGYKLTMKDKAKKALQYIDTSKNVNILSNEENVHKVNVEHDTYTITAYVKELLNDAHDADEMYPKELALMYSAFAKMYDLRNTAIVTLLISICAFVFLMAFLLASTKKESDPDSVFEKLPVDIILLLSVIITVAAIVVMIDVVDSVILSDISIYVLIYSCMVIAVSVALTGALWYLVARIKRKHWWKKTVIFYTFTVIRHILLWCISVIKKMSGVIRRVVRKLPIVWKTVVCVIIVLVANLIISINFYWSTEAVICWIIGAAIISVGTVYTSLCMKRLKLAAEKLAAGDLEHKVDKKGLFLDFADHADNLNCIGKVMTAAVEDRIKSERFKAELITNVSHDIKTPLTSIINYVDLLEKENIEDEKIKEYIDVLDRQSKRLKKLTEDIVDASKAATGNVKMDFAPCKVGLIMSQTIGEYVEKAESVGLEFVIKLPEEELEILADGRRLWRVFDNLLNNICKYSQQGTRVYISLENKDRKAVITYRNVSKYELDITEEELMERFVRGDKSRNTEGSGLGLSIARNLVELQGGSFYIQIDGDLFKVVIMFPLMNL